jgi:UDP-N-acetylglucosamine transferase subunit ALG13
MEHSEMLSPGRVDELTARAELIVAHAGMGSVLTALRHRRAILVLPRIAARGEHRNDHQLATARWLSTRPGVHVAWDEAELAGRLDGRRSLLSGPPIPEHASEALIARLSEFIRS